MSTAYPPRFVRYVLSSQKERNAARVSSMTPDYFGHLPPSFSLYYWGPGKDFLSQRFYLKAVSSGAAGPEVEVLHAVSFHKGPGSQQVTIYSSLEHGTTPLAVAINEIRYGSSATITLPGVNGDAPRTERLRYNGFRLNTYTFTLRGETFELQEDKTKKPKKRQILWLKAASSQSSRMSKTDSTNSQDKEDYETEVVATWTEGSVPNRNGLVGTFQFGSTDTMQELGEYWALLAVTSTLAVCQQGEAIEGARSWNEEKKLEKGNYV